MTSVGGKVINGQRIGRFLASREPVRAPTRDTVLEAEPTTYERIQALVAEGDPRMRVRGGVVLADFLKKEHLEVVGENDANEIALKIASDWFGNEMGKSAAQSSPLVPVAFASTRRHNPTEFAANRGAPMTGTEEVFRTRDPQLGRESVFQTEVDVLEAMNLENSKLWDVLPDANERPTNDRAPSLGSCTSGATMAEGMRKFWAGANGEPSTISSRDGRAASRAGSVRTQVEAINEMNRKHYGG